MITQTCFRESKNSERKMQYHIDKNKPHSHLLSTHFYIRDYKTSFVDRPRQLAHPRCKNLSPTRVT